MTDLFSKTRFPKEEAGMGTKIFVWLFFLSLIFLVLVKVIPLKKADSLKREMRQASEYMAEAEAVLVTCRAAKGFSPDERFDINGTGLIGVEFSSITTSIGNLAAKRTTTNPNMAGLIVMLLHRAGVRRGDNIAVGASSSFPALIIAVLAAAKTMHLKPLIICSLGASQWGANDPDFIWLDMWDCIVLNHVFDFKMRAVSLGGDKDMGEDMSLEGQAILREAIRKSGIFFVQEPNLSNNVSLKMRIYEEAAAETEIRAFINIGGSFTNMGEDSEILQVKPGLAQISQFPPEERQGMVFAMAARKIPVLHLLYIRGLVQHCGLPWDPQPLPRPGEGDIYTKIREKDPVFLFLAGLYLLAAAGILIFRFRAGRKRDLLEQ